MVWRPYRSRRDSGHNLVRIAFAMEIWSYNLNHFSGNPQEVGYGRVINGFTISNRKHNYPQSNSVSNQSQDNNTY